MERAAQERVLVPVRVVRDEVGGVGGEGDEATVGRDRGLADRALSRIATGRVHVDLNGSFLYAVVDEDACFAVGMSEKRRVAAIRRQGVAIGPRVLKPKAHTLGRLPPPVAEVKLDAVRHLVVVEEQDEPAVIRDRCRPRPTTDMKTGRAARGQVAHEDIGPQLGRVSCEIR